MSEDERLRDLVERLTQAADSLWVLAQDEDKERRMGKREGVLLALSYTREALRATT